MPGVRAHPARGLAVTGSLFVACAAGLVQEYVVTDEYDYGYDEGPSGWWWFFLLLFAGLFAMRVADAKTELRGRRRDQEAMAEQRAVLAWRADHGTRLGTLELMQTLPPPLPRGHEKVMSVGATAGAAGHVAYDLWSGFDFEDVLDPLTLAFSVGDLALSGYDRLPHRKRAIAVQCAAVVERGRELADQKNAVRAAFLHHVTVLGANYQDERQRLDQRKAWLPHSRRRRTKKLDQVRRKQRLAVDAAKL